MKSRWYELKPAVLALRRNGKSLTFIEKHLGVPRSTLSTWCKDIHLSDKQKYELTNSRLEALSRARLAAATRHREAKRQRIEAAKRSASKTLAALTITPAIIELALAMLYWGEGKKTQTTALGSSDTQMLSFFISALRAGFNVSAEGFTAELHLRQDQNSEQEIRYWSKQLNIPQEQFKRVYFDKRSGGKTYDTYHGVCLLYCSDIAIQRKLVYLYKSFADDIIKSSGD